MLYASTRYSLLKSLGSTLFKDSIFATSKNDLTPDAYVSHLRHVAAPNPLSNREQEMADLRASESKTATYGGSSARASHIGAGIGFNWSDEAERVVVELGEGSDSCLVILTIDTKTESLCLHSTRTTDIDSLSSIIPSSEPCYALFAWTSSLTSNPVREIVFIYSCPSTSPIKNRMLYSSGSASTYEAAKNILASSSPAVTVASRKIETSDPKELDEAFFKAELGLENVTAPERIENPRGFAKPKGPPRRR
ncbi:hypothetical protein GALMADRAFT_239463 [Galerina marginata CBS 339.88]|uniref:ADF-H domain-containing protein n=1 Tax=Galerina marginata (strain CBS 339.88) TaxID=685588 RepID=A0A067TE71_GALM3|nr:hypothetical protein GALMADRAFT_239463 [Galerina marginata CBS 339.88]